MKKIRVGFLGGGGILGAHAPGYLDNPDLCEVVAVAEPNAARAEAIHKLLGPDVEIVNDYREVVGRDDIDAVDIILPHDLHMPATIAAAEAGKHVLVEKVMARNVWECDRMIEACEKSGVSLTVCHDRRYNGEWMGLKQIVDSGVLGEIFQWKLDHNQDVKPVGSWIASYKRLGGGAIMSCLTHQIDALRWFGGDVDSVTSMTRSEPSRMEGEFMGMIIARMKSGALANLTINWWTRSHTGKNSLWYEMVHVCGSKGEAYTMSGRGTFVRLHEAHDAAIKQYGEQVLTDFVPVESGNWPGHPRCIKEWLKSLRGEPSLLSTTGPEGRAAVEVAEAAYQSVQTGRQISLPIQPRPWGN